LERQSISNEAVQFDRKISKLNQEFTAVVEKISKLEVKKVSFESKQNGVKMADSDYRIEEIKRLTRELEIRIQDEEKRLDTLLEDETNLNTELQTSSTKRSHVNTRLDDLRMQMNKFDLRIETLQEKNQSRDQLFTGVKSILDNVNVIPGVIGTVQDLINVEEKYLNAVGAVLQQGALQNVVMETAKGVKVA